MEIGSGVSGLGVDHVGHSVSVIAVSYWTVLMAELIGDKSLYTVATLGLRFPVPLVFVTMSVAYGGKMLAAILLGGLMTQLPSPWIALLSAALFFLSALLIWFKRELAEDSSDAAPRGSFRAGAICFGSLFFAEWGDPAQLSAAALTSHAHVAWWGPWLGGTLALVTKGTLALTIGLGLRGRMPVRLLRTVASISCCVLGVLALWER